jgi:hypothetical protein
MTTARIILIWHLSTVGHKKSERLATTITTLDVVIIVILLLGARPHVPQVREGGRPPVGVLPELRL